MIDDQHQNRILVGYRLPAMGYRRLFRGPKIKKEFFPCLRSTKMALNSFGINKTTSKPSSIFVDFYRFLCAKRPFFAPKSPPRAF
jgi:hypothetical protein